MYPYIFDMFDADSGLCLSYVQTFWSQTKFGSYTCRSFFSCFSLDRYVNEFMKVKSDHCSKFSNLSTVSNSSVGRASHRYPEGHGFESRWTCWSPDFFSLCHTGYDFFRFLLSNCLNWKIYCDDHSSLSSTIAVQIWIISYKLHIYEFIQIISFSIRQKFF